MNLACFLDDLRDVVGVRSTAEMNRDRMLASRDVDDWWWRWKEGLVLGEVRDTERSGHDDKA